MCTSVSEMFVCHGTCSFMELVVSLITTVFACFLDG